MIADYQHQLINFERQIINLHLVHLEHQATTPSRLQNEFGANSDLQTKSMAQILATMANPIVEQVLNNQNCLLYLYSFCFLCFRRAEAESDYAQVVN